MNRQNARNWDAFLQHVTDDVKSTEAVRDLCTPTGGTRVTCYDDLVDKECYVAVSRGRFRDIGYIDTLLSSSSSSWGRSRGREQVLREFGVGDANANRPPRILSYRYKKERSVAFKILQNLF